VVAYDRRGFGATTAGEEPHDDVADLLAVTEASGARPAILVGNSRGGGLALDVALAYPDHVSALVLIAPAPSGYPDDDWPTIAAEAQQDELIERAEAAGDLDLVNRLEVRYWLDGVDQPEGRVAGVPRELMLEMNGTALGAGPIGKSALYRPVWPHLDEITMPVLVIAGEYDLPGINQMCARLAAALPNAQLATIAGSAHCPSLDQPDALNVVVLDFLESIGL
jgi:pimeloyl-ACP methyl ester carboxylesterase